MDIVGFSGSGTFTTDDGPTYLITGITGTANGNTITSLLSPGTLDTNPDTPDNLLTLDQPSRGEGFAFRTTVEDLWLFYDYRSITGYTMASSDRPPIYDVDFTATLATGSVPGTTPSNPILPTPNPNNPNGFTFPNVTVTPSQRRFFDPDVAIGYDYAVTGGPLFSSVLIPNALPQWAFRNRGTQGLV